MSARERHQISASPLAPFKLAEEVSHGCVGIRHCECEPIGFAARRQGHRHRIASNFDAGRAVSKHDGHANSPKDQRLPLLTPPEARSEYSQSRNQFCKRSSGINARTQFLNTGVLVGINRPVRRSPFACASVPSNPPHATAPASEPKASSLAGAQSILERAK